MKPHINASENFGDPLLDPECAEPQWIPDERAPNCTKCLKEFGMFFRRHHCRLCLKVYCSVCSVMSSITVEGVAKQVRVCHKCNAMHAQFNKYRDMHMPLLTEQMSSQEREQQDKQSFNVLMSIEKGFPSRNYLPSPVAGNNFVSDFTRRSTMNSNGRSTMFRDGDLEAQQRKATLANADQDTRKSLVTSWTKEVAQKSVQNATAIQSYLKTNHFSGRLDSVYDSMAPSEGMTMKALDSKFEEHMNSSVLQILHEFKLDEKKWLKVLLNCTRHVVATIKPSSRCLNDSTDFNQFVKIVTVRYPNQDKCRYVNGIVFKKEVAHRRMRTEVDNPKILLLSNSLGYVQEDENFIDLEAEIKQEESFMQIIQSKIQLVNPDIIFVEKDASRLAVETLLKDNRTIVTNTSPKMMTMIARCTQTITCPSTNLIDRNFVVGNCLKFKLEKIDNPKGLDRSQLILGESKQAKSEAENLMCLEGCLSKLGCSIILSGPDKSELQLVRKALKKCLRTARTLVLEREYLIFLKPDLLVFEPQKKSPSEANNAEMTFIEEDQPKKKKYTGPRTSPYLFEKHLARDFLVFEHFSLATANQIDKGDQEYQLNQNERRKDANQRTNSSFAQAPQPTFVHKQREANVKRRLQFMCYKPQRQIVKFYADSNDKDTKPGSTPDISLFAFLKSMAFNSTRLCIVEDCKKPGLIHEDYWYHDNGCVQVKTQEDAPQGQTGDQLRAQLGEVSTVVVYCYCKECKGLVMQKREVPPQMLEMSFFKLLEQYFYNQELVVNNKGTKVEQPIRSSVAMQMDCNHSFHLDCTMVFKFGPVKVILSYEPAEEYTLDLTHFGTMPGIFSQNEIQGKIIKELERLRYGVQKGFSLLIDWTKTLKNFVDNLTDELNTMLIPGNAGLALPFTHSNQQLQQRYTSILSATSLALDQLLGQLISFLLQTLRGVFGKFVEENDINNQFNQELQDDPSAGMIKAIKTSMQQLRIQKLISARTCEFLHVLRSLQSHFFGEMLTKCFYTTKKGINIFLINQPEEDRPKESQFSSSVLQTTTNPFVEITPSMEKRGTGHDYPRQVFKTEISEPLHGPSYTTKQLYREALLLEARAKSSQIIKYLVENSAMIPYGFNKNGVAANPKDLSSLIATALSSNLYFNGLIASDYMGIQDKLVYAGEHSQASDNKNDTSILLEAESKVRVKQSVELSQDVLNENVPLQMCESELLRSNDYHFWFAFSTSLTPEMQVYNGKQEKALYIDGENEVKELTSRCEEIPWNIPACVEQPMSRFMFSELQTLALQLEGLKAAVERQKAVKPRSRLDTSMQIDAAVDGGRLETSFVDIRQSMILRDVESVSVSDEDWLVERNKAYAEVYHLFHEQVDFIVKVLFATHFEALRKMYCGSYNDFLKSVFQSEVWEDNSGGKSRSTFFKSFDNKFVLKAVKSSEVKMFEEMSLSYFEYMCRSFCHQCPTSIAKILGIFKITVKNHTTRKTEKFYLLLMENLLLHVDKNNCLMYDLKGSKRNRYIAARKPGEVALDNNFLQDMRSRPICLQYQMKKLLQIAINNDSFYLAQHSIIDYSLFVVIDELRKTIRVGIIDYIQQYTLEKGLESVIKQAVNREEPTIINPELYKHRFRAAMDKYFLALVPDSNANLNEVITEQFKADKIEWFTKEQDKQEKDPQ